MDSRNRSSVAADAGNNIVTVRAAHFDQVAAENGSAAVEAGSLVKSAGISSFVGEELVKSDRTELSAAKVNVSGFRAL